MNTETPEILLEELMNYIKLIENLDKTDQDYNKTRFQHFINRLQVLCNNHDYKNTSDLLNAILYTLGESISPREFSFSSGFNKWKTILISQLLKGMPHS